MTLTNGPSPRPTRRSPRNAVRALALLAGLALPGAAALADTISYSSTGTGRGLAVDGTIQRIENGNLLYTSTASGKLDRKPLDQVVLIKSASEPNLSAAEEAFANQKWADAAAAYAKAMDSSSKDWVRQRAMVRLIEAGQKSGQFGPQAKAFVELAKVDVAQASKLKPTAPKDKPAEAKTALDETDRALGGTLRPEQRALLQNFRIELLIALGRQDEANKAIGAAAPAVTPGASAGNPLTPGAPAVAAPVPTDAPGRRIAADSVLIRAQSALQTNNFAGVIGAIDSSKPLFTDPTQQAKALFLIAQAKEHMAGADPAKLQEAAIAYMKVVAYFDGSGGRPAAPEAPDALWKVAEIQEKVKNGEEALQIYKKIAEDPKSPNHDKAKKRIAELAAAAKG